MDECKTPVSALYELCATRFTQPTFTLTHNGVNTLNPFFKFEVKFAFGSFNISAVGSGRSKKEAKHDAAKVALEEISKLNLRDNKHKVVVISDLENKECHAKAVKELSDLCEDRNLPQPMYFLIHESGPAHAKLFTMKCKVAVYEQDENGHTKKAAKQLAAFKMVEFLKPLEDVGTSHLVPTSKEALNRILEEKVKARNIKYKSKSVDDPFDFLDKETRLRAIEMIKNQSLEPEMRLKNTLAFLKIDFHITDVATVTGKPLLLMKWNMEPQIQISDYCLMGLYDRANRYLDSFLT
uniref:Putative interferon-inducible double stranded rna-dependent protein kinase activator a n=1 Tax=Xenopsylla cheopis TaxID=163159 RepID=A0A6M2DU68_XENCH